MLEARVLVDRAWLDAWVGSRGGGPGPTAEARAVFAVPGVYARLPGEAPPQAHPDLGCSFETFTNADMLELETLGPMTRLAPGESVTHTERWSLHGGVRMEKWTDEELDSVISVLL